MWGLILKTLAEKIFNNIFKAFISNKNKEKNQKKFAKDISLLTNELFQKFEGSTLDCTDFYDFLETYCFRKFIFDYFNMSFDGYSTSKITEVFIDYVHKQTNNCSKQDIRDFISSLDELYKQHLHKTINENTTLCSLWQLIVLNNRTIYEKINESEESIKKYFQTYEKPKQLNESIDLQKYHETCTKEFSRISFTGISGAETKENQRIEDLYVENKFMIIYNILFNNEGRNNQFADKDKYNYEEESPYVKLLGLRDLFNYSKRIVIVGGAGYGKTTTVNYLFCKYTHLYSQDILRIKINLKDYYKSIEDNVTIISCLISEVTKKVPNSKKANIENTLNEYLENGSTLVIFDALDEIPSDALREKARNEISAFVDIYYLNKFIITTREVGYLRNKFTNDFLHVRICPFNNKQKKRYAESWFKKSNKITGKEEDFDSFYVQFLKEANNAKCVDIIGNPITLVLSLIIFDAEKSLPHRRVEFYKKCIETFLNTREERRGTQHLSQRAKDILCDSSIVPKIAFYKYKEFTKNSDHKLTKDELNRAIINALEVPDKYSWNSAVNEFSRYLIERTELIYEIDEDNYDFSHKTFGDYFLACYFANNIMNDELTQLLSEWIGDPNYDELARLIIEVVIQQNQAHQHAAVIDMLFSQLKSLSKSIKKEKNLSNYIFLRDKLSDYLSVTQSLMKNGMLIPKYKGVFYLMLLDNPILIRRERETRLPLSKYINCTIDYYHFTNISSNKYNNDCNLVDLTERFFSLCKLYFYDRRIISEITKLFISSHGLSNEIGKFYNALCELLITNDPFNDDDPVKAIDYNELVELLENNINLYESPSMFLFVVNYICNQMIDINAIDINILMKFNFECNNLARRFININLLKILLGNMMTNSKWFIINLLILSKCVGPGASYYLNPSDEELLVYDMETIGDDSITSDLIKCNTSIIKCLFKCENKDKFFDKLKYLEVYDVDLTKLYMDCFLNINKYYNENKHLYD